MTEGSNPLDGLEERLKNHSKAFESLLALTPAQEYYGTAIVDGRDPSEQWRAKRQSKAEKKAARKAKLDPANQKSALDVMKEREKKRKRELGMESDGEEADEAEVPMMPVTSKKAKVVHKPQNSEIPDIEEDGEAQSSDKTRPTAGQKKKQKREKQKEKKAKKEAKQAKRQADDQGAENDEEADLPMSNGHADVEDIDVEGLGDITDSDDDDDAQSNPDMPNVEEQEHEDEDQASTAPSSPAIDSPAFDISANHSTTSSSSSILPPSTADGEAQSTTTKKTNSDRPSLSIAMPKPVSATSLLKAEASSRTSSPKPQFPKVDQAILQERLRIRIEELRARRKAHGADGQPARSRQELLDQRRRKEESRKAVKKEQRRKAKEEEARKQEERLRGSGSPLSGADIFSPRSEINSFSFSRLAFGDGSMADASLTKLVNAPKQKGPQDVKTALLAAESKQKRLSGLDAEKRADIDEKDRWLNASKRAHGERVRDDQSLLKKALKRKDKQKSKSEKDWQDRAEAVVKGKEMKQKKREGALAKRRDEKGGGSKQKKPAKKKGRPGFEGRFKA